ncbi:MAG: phosphoadenosine phosphosulfate reductase family protein [Rhodocyclaceae bacterium]|nr:phosphoadenosine phosphosulfate reductase family protein [Rhodocyclaceae bacterium]
MIQFSGGRTSAFMLHQIIEANGPLHERVVVSFQNTGREFNETLDFVQECGERWNVRIVWLEYRPDAPRFEVVSHNSAARDGEPFEALIRKRKFLPNRVARFCTAEMKVHCASRFARSLGWERWTSAIGIRADEPTRLGGSSPRERWAPWRPMVDAGVSKRDVSAFWASQPFDLRLTNVDGRTPRGNCDGCFLKSEANRAALARDFPERFAWWVRMEELSGSTFRPAEPYAALADFVKHQGRLFDENGEWCQADDGECFG